MELVTLITGPIEVNTYILYGKNAGECLIVDPSDTAMVEAECRKLAVRPTHILLTHGHFDHILSVADLQKTYGAKVCIHEADSAALTGGRMSLSAMMGMGVKRCAPDILLKGGETLSCAGFSVKVLHTPGHSKGSVCYAIEEEKLVFSGDTLFRLSVGRTDLPGGDANELYSSIAYCLFRLEGEYDVYPGHMEKTSLEYERQRNPFVNRWSPDTW
ncbi:MAG TPA: MBL fold metallo-hydrolase [Clostridia bacterium]|nr:MBL fold metallo-hydrolase [Clostridia bacterium]